MHIFDYLTVEIKRYGTGKINIRCEDAFKKRGWIISHRITVVP